MILLHSAYQSPSAAWLHRYDEYSSHGCADPAPAPLRLSIFFGAALGNVVRGVPLNSAGEFFLPMWTDFGVTGAVGILDWYTVTVGLLTYVTLAHHGALWVAMKTDNAIQVRARRIGGVAWWMVVGLTAATTILTMRVQPKVWTNLSNYSWGVMFPPRTCAGRPRSGVCLPPKRSGSAGVSGFVRLHCRNADQRCFWRLSLRASLEPG